MFPKRQEDDPKGGNLRLAQVRKPEFTIVNEDFQDKLNTNFTLLSHPLITLQEPSQASSPANPL